MSRPRPLHAAASGTRIGLLALAGALAVSSPVLAQDDRDAEGTLTMADLFSGAAAVKFYGFVHVDTAYDDSRFNDPQLPGFVQSEDPTAPPQIGADDNQDEYTLHARLTRLGLTFDGPTITALNDANLGGRVEVDFYGGGSDSRNFIRLRRAYIDLEWESWSVLAGQEWDLISPLYPAVNGDLVMWGAGNLGDRRPQVRAEHRAAVGGGTLTSSFGIGLSGAIENREVEGGLNAGEAAGRPMLNARVGWESDGGFEVGVWGHQSEERVDVDPDPNVSDEREFDSYSVGLDLFVPLREGTWFKSEVWTGENLDDVRGGIFQGVNSVTNEEIASSGGFVELGQVLTDSLTLHVGASTDDPSNEDLATQQRSDNDVYYATLKWRYEDFRMGFEVLHWETEYVDLEDGDALRFVYWISYSF